jgi:hypothetical protein
MFVEGKWPAFCGDDLAERLQISVREWCLIVQGGQRSARSMMFRMG